MTRTRHLITYPPIIAFLVIEVSILVDNWYNGGYKLLVVPWNKYGLFYHNLNKKVIAYPTLHENIDRIIVEQLKKLETKCKNMVLLINFSFSFKD